MAIEKPLQSPTTTNVVLKKQLFFSVWCALKTQSHGFCKGLSEACITDGAWHWKQTIGKGVKFTRGKKQKLFTSTIELRVVDIQKKACKSTSNS